MGTCTSTHSPVTLQPCHWNPRLYHGNDSYLQCYVAVSRCFHEGLVTLIESEGCEAARFPSPSLFPYKAEATLQAVRGTPFHVIYRFLTDLGLTPQVYLEPQVDNSKKLSVCSIGTFEDVDWISLFLDDADRFKHITKLCDLTVHNFGRMLVVAPKLFTYRDQGSMSSMMGQCGSANDLSLTPKHKDATRFATVPVPNNPHLSTQQQSTLEQQP